jgi:hypothetical protein
MLGRERAGQKPEGGAFYRVGRPDVQSEEDEVQEIEEAEQREAERREVHDREYRE